MRWWLVLCVGFLCGLSGCTADDKAGVSLDLQSLNWQTGVIGALLLWMDKSIVLETDCGGTSADCGVPAADRNHQITGD
jgi:hypothetical protein